MRREGAAGDEDVELLLDIRREGVETQPGKLQPSLGAQRHELQRALVAEAALRTDAESGFQLGRPPVVAEVSDRNRRVGERQADGLARGAIDESHLAIGQGKFRDAELERRFARTWRGL